MKNKVREVRDVLASSVSFIIISKAEEKEVVR